MSKGVYIGVSGTARKVKKMYTGVGGAARKVKKAYIDVGGAARLFYASGPPMITSRLTGSNSHANAAIANINDKYIVVGEKSGYSKIYDKSFTQLSSTSNGSSSIYGSNSVGVHGVFLLSGTLWAFNDSLTRTTINASLGRTNVRIGPYLVSGSSAIDASLTVLTIAVNITFSTTAAARPYVRFGAQVGNWGCYTKKWDTIGTINIALTAGADISALSLYYKTAWSRAGSKYAIAAGGNNNNDSSDDSNNKAWAVDAALTLISDWTITHRREGMASFTLGDYAIFSGSDYKSGISKTEIDVFDTSLIKTMNNYRTVDSYCVAGESFCDIGAFIGGTGVSSGSAIKNIDILTF